MSVTSHGSTTAVGEARLSWSRATTSHRYPSLLTGLDLEVERDEREDEALEVLDEVVEHAQALSV